MITVEQKLALLENLRPIDDVFFEMLARSREVDEEILSTILNDDISVSFAMTQATMRNFMAKSVILDAQCLLNDSKNTMANIEVQRANISNHIKRVRYNGSTITVRNSNPGMDYQDVPEVCIIYISEKDFLKKGKTIYHVKKSIQETGETIDDGLNEIYVNAEINDGSKTAALMKCFMQKDVDDKRFPRLSAEVKRLKRTKGGIRNMCKLLDDLIASDRDNVRAELMDEVREEVMTMVRIEVREEVKDEVREEVKDEVREEVKAEILAEISSLNQLVESKNLYIAELERQLGIA